MGKRVGELLLYGVFIVADAEGIYPYSHLIGLSIFVVETIGLVLYDGWFTQTQVAIVGTAASVIAIFIHFTFPYPTPSPVIGWLQPANEPTPPNGCDRTARDHPDVFDPKKSVLVVLGNNGYFRSKGLTPTPMNRNVIHMAQCQLLSLETGPNGARIDALIYDKSGTQLGQIEANKFTIQHNERLFIEKSGDLSTLVVHDTDGHELLYVRYLNPSAFRIRGIFTCPTPKLRTLIINDSEIVGFPFQDSCSGDNGGGDVVID